MYQYSTPLHYSMHALAASTNSVTRHKVSASGNITRSADSSCLQPTRRATAEGSMKMR